jgi:hypothetical protein
LHKTLRCPIGCSRKKSRTVLQDTTSVHIYAQKTTILKMHMVRIKVKKTMGEEIMLQISLSSSQAGKQRFLVNNIQFTT